MPIKSVKDHIHNLKSWVPDERVIKLLEGTCFHQLAQLHSHAFTLKHDIPLLAAIICSYKCETGVFDFGGNDVLFGLEDVLYMTGLPVDGLEVSGVDGNFSQVCKEYLGQDGKVGKTGCVRLKWLRKEFEKLPEDTVDGSEQFMWCVRAYVLYIIGSIVLPTKTGTFISISFLPLLRHKKDFNKYAWGAALLAHLHRALKRCLMEGSNCVAGHTYSLMLFAIERIPRLALQMMGKRHVNEGDIEDFLSHRPTVFPLIWGWGEVLHQYSNNNHRGEEMKKYSKILRKQKAEEIIWQPYRRLYPISGFLPEHLVGQQRMGLSRTILLCFEIAMHHRPDLCPRQFGLDLVKELPKLRRIKKDLRRAGHETDWRTNKYMKPLIEEWQRREELLIGDVPNYALANDGVMEDGMLVKEETGQRHDNR